ncbi:MAG: chloride channel protein, partial [Nitrospinota bacterium]
VFGVGYETISLSLTGKFGLFLLLALGLVKVFATSVTLGSGGSGGIFAPSLFIGAMIGGLFGTIVHGLFPEITASSGAYALVGMGAVVAAATHAPITAIVIIFEMTGDYLAILPLMASCILGVLITTSLKTESIYTLKLIRRGEHIMRVREVSILRSLCVKDVMRDDLLTIPKDMPFRELLDLALNSEYSYFPVVDERGELSGIFSLSDLFHALRKPEAQRDGLVAADLGTTRVLTVTPLDDLDKVLERFGRINVEELPVVSSEGSRKVIGRVRMQDLMEAYRREVLRRSAEGA